MTALPGPTEQLARELWEAHATHNQEAVGFPIEHWEVVDGHTREHWMLLARVAMSFRPSQG